MNRTFFMRTFALVLSLALAAFAQSSCDDNPSNEALKLRIKVYSGNNQTERAGSTLPEPLVVQVTDILNNPRPGVPVEFSAHAEPSALVTPRLTATDERGLASCSFRLGTTVGTQNVWAATSEDSTLFSATAIALACEEEDPEGICVWPSKHIFIATTSSSLLSGAGSVVIDFNPADGNISKVLETTDRIDGISFSSRGELFVSSENGIRKIDPATHDPEPYTSFDSPLYGLSMEPNPGGVLTGLTDEAPQLIGCPGSLIDLGSDQTPANILWENLAADPVTRDVYLLTGNPTGCVLWRGLWDGRATAIESYEVVASISVFDAEPRGMCADSSGTIYICFDGNDTQRRIVAVSADGTIDYDFFNFYTYYENNSREAGRWGDIAYLGGKLFVIDRRNDRLVVISKTGEWLAEFEDDAFSMPLVETDHYAICASAYWGCPMK